MKRIINFFIAASLLLYACNSANNDRDADEDTAMNSTDTGLTIGPDTSISQMRDHAEANISATKNDTIVSGRVTFDNAANGQVKMDLEINIQSMAGKSVAVHIHEDGDCGNAGEMAHGHWNPTNEQHGKWGSSSYHSGDIGNVKLDKNGKGTMTLTTDRWSLGGSADKNIIGKAIIVHSGEDDYKSQPSGKAGSRIGCGVIQ